MQTLTPEDEFTSPVTGVADGDSPTAENLNSASQDLTNRTEWLGNRVGWCAQGTFTVESGLTSSSFLGIGSLSDVTGKGFTTVPTTMVKVPAPGVYEVDFYTQLVTDSTTDHITLGVSIYVENTSAGQFLDKRVDDEPTTQIYPRGSVFVTITDEDTQRVRFRLTTATGSVSVEASSRWKIKRVG